MQAQVSKWGDSLAVRIPQGIAHELGLESGTAVELVVREGEIVLIPIRSAPTLDQLVAGITEENRHAETDWGSPVGNEVLLGFG